MNRLLLIFLLISNTIIAQVDLSLGLKAYYPFNGNAKDESGNGNHASSVKASFAKDRLGKPNAACAFNGKSNYIRIPDDASLHFKTGFSISAWVLVNDFYEGKCHGNRIIMKGYTDYLQGNYLLTFDDNYSGNGNNCYTDQPDKKRQSFYAPSALPFTNDYIVPGKWYQLTYTYDGTTALLYVDCTLQAKGSIKNYNFSNNHDLFFGKMDNPQYPYWFNGLLDEVRLYNRALSKEEVLALCDKKQVQQGQQVPFNPCTEDNIVAAKFNYTISNCTSVSAELLAKKTKNLKTIQWLFGDGTSSNKMLTTHTYKKSGKYTIKAITTSKTGCTDTFSTAIVLRDLQSDFSFSEQGEPGKIQFKANNNNASYSWSFGDNTFASNEAVVTHAFRQKGEYRIRMIARNSSGCTDTVEKKIFIDLPDLITETVPQVNPIIVTESIAKASLEKRNKDIIRSIPVDSDSLSVSLYDNGLIDGDSITLVYNGAVILTHQLLGGNPISFRLKVEPGNNELLMYAENLGSIPPNTALLIIYDGNNRYEVNISSNKSSNGVVIFVPKKTSPISSQ